MAADLQENAVPLMILAPLMLAAAPAPAPAVVCKRAGSYTIVSRERADEPGTDILVRKGAGARCAWIAGPKDFEVPVDHAEYYRSLAGDYLVTDSGTGPSTRMLTIYSISTRQKLWSGPYQSEGDVVVTARNAIFWQPTTIPATAANCPSYAADSGGGLTDVIADQIRLVLPSLNAIRLAASRCFTAQ